jgi:uncharacterized protein YcbK (DUF882 family)
MKEKSALVALLVLGAAGSSAAEVPKKKPVQAAHYGDHVRKWHTPAANKAPVVDASGRAVLVLVSLNTGDRLELVASTDSGGFPASSLDRAAYVLREPSSGNEYPLEPRLLDVLYRIQIHFRAQEIRVISGYRTPGTSASNHGRGRAADIIVPSASDADVAAFSRQLGFMGVGIYPTSGFVHVDVRDRSYFWVDASGPGRRNRERGVFPDLARRSDTRALSRGEHATPPFGISKDVDGVLQAHAPSNPSSSDEEDEDDST